MVQNRTGIMDLQNKNNILVANNENLEIRSQCKVLCFEVYFASPPDIKLTMQTVWRRLLLVPLSAVYIQDMEYMENEKHIFIIITSV